MKARERKGLTAEGAEGAEVREDKSDHQGHEGTKEGEVRMHVEQSDSQGPVLALLGITWCSWYPSRGY
jgi:hypothetical protein